MILKKSTVLFLAFLLLVSNIGFAFQVHYCGNTVASISLKTTFKPATVDKNCCGITEEKSHCCSDKIFHVQKKSDHGILKVFSFQSCPLIILQVPTVVLLPVLIFKENSVAFYRVDAHAPPLFKLYSQYIFYDRF